MGASLRASSFGSAFSLFSCVSFGGSSALFDCSDLLSFFDFSCASFFCSSAGFWGALGSSAFCRESLELAEETLEAGAGGTLRFLGRAAGVVFFFETQWTRSAALRATKVARAASRVLHILRRTSAGGRASPWSREEGGEQEDDLLMRRENPSERRAGRERRQMLSIRMSLEFLNVFNLRWKVQV